jgi:hypothetical protein
MKFSKQNEYLCLLRRLRTFPIFAKRDAIFPTLILWKQSVAGWIHSKSSDYLSQSGSIYLDTFLLPGRNPVTAYSLRPHFTSRPLVPMPAFIQPGGR